MEAWIAVFLFGVGMGAYGLIAILIQKHRGANQTGESGKVSVHTTVDG